jgi:hypothetical protein
MIKTVKDISIVIVLAFLALNLHSYFSMAWFQAFIDSRTFSVPFGWIYPNFILHWIPTLFVYVPFGYIVERLLRSRVPFFWPIAFGVICTTVWILTSHIGFTGDAGVVDYVWHYSLYVMPPIGGFLGGLVATKVSSRLTTRCNGRGKQFR